MNESPCFYCCKISVTKDVGLLFFLMILFSKYSKLKLGRDDDKPEFSDITYFTMLFACGIGIGIFYFSVAETIFHYEPGHYGNRYYNRYIYGIYMNSLTVWKYFLSRRLQYLFEITLAEMKELSNIYKTYFIIFGQNIYALSCEKS